MPPPPHTLRLLLHLILAISFLLPSFPTRAAPPEPTPPATSTPQPEPAAVTPTPNETLAPTQAITPTPTDTLLPTQSITPTLDVTATPTISPTLESKPASEPLSLTPLGGGFLPSSPLSISWQVSDPDATAVVSVTAPAGLTPLIDSGVTYDPLSNSLSQPAASGEGVLSWSVPEGLEGSLELQGSLLLDGKTVYTTTLTVAEEGYHLLPPAGGTASGLGGSVQVSFPGGEVKEAVELRIRKARDLPLSPPSGYAVEILAEGHASGEKLTHFSQPLTIEIAYQEGSLNNSEDFAHLVTYDPLSGNWLALPSQVDTQANRVRGLSDHLSVFAIDASGWEASRLPGMQAYQVSAFSGAASYSLPLWTPPGPGGLQPELSLSYTSQAVEAALPRLSQASWAGMGWSLDTGSIERDQHGTPNVLTDDSFTLQAGGVSSLLLKDSSGSYHLADELFWKVSYDAAADSWTAWDKQGTRYIFGDTASTRAQYPSGYNHNCSGELTTDATTWRWSLHRVVSIFQQELTFSYFTDYQNKHHPCDDTLDFSTAIAVYPAEISYPNGAYRVVFEREARTDYNLSWENEENLIFYQKYRLKAVQVYAVNNLLREYRLGYASQAVIFPGYQWTPLGGYALTLSSLQEYGLGGTSSLPATTFSYADGLHLTSATNGYGGRVDFSYESPAWHDTDTPASRKDHIDFNSNTKHCDSADGDYDPDVWDGDVSCDGFRMKVTGTAYRDTPGDYQPAAWYRLWVVVNNPTSSPRSVTLGLDHGGGVQYSTPVVLPAWSGSYTLSQDFLLPLSGVSRVRQLIQCSHCRVEKTELMRLPGMQRVLSQSLYDGIDANPQVFSYQYDEPASNDASHSAAAAISDPYYPAYSQPRGHAAVRQLGPDGLLTTTYFHQDDARKGVEHSSLLAEESYHQAGEASWDDGGAWSGSGVTPALERLQGDGAQKLVAAHSNWSDSLQRTSYALTDGKAAWLQFRLGGTGEAVLAIDNDVWGSNYRRWGIFVDVNNGVQAQYCLGQTCQAHSILMSGDQFKRDAWYVLLLIVDDDEEFLARLWQRDEPGTVVQASREMDDGRSWRFRCWANNAATLWLDEYSEGRLYSLQSSRIAVQVNPNYISISPPRRVGGADYSELVVSWTYPEWQQSLTFDGDGEWVGVKTSYYYDPVHQGNVQYGNLTRREESSCNGSSWQSYRAELTQYYPYISSNAYLVGLPGRRGSYACPVGCDYQADDLAGETWYLYDGSINFDDPPGIGVLSGERRLLSCTGGDCRYADTAYGYDAWGNRILVAAYTDAGDEDSLWQGTAQTTYTCYGTANQPTGCSDDGYHSYPLWQRNALGQQVSWSYSGAIYPGSTYTGYAIAAPVSEVDANNASTTAEYDGFGRLSKLVRPGDSSAAPTLALGYFDTATPFYTLATQKIDASTSFSLRKYYDGLGRLKQTQILSAQIGGQARDVKVDFVYDGYGRVVAQSMPYDVATGGGYLQAGTYHTTTSYDLAGRLLRVTAPDGSYTENTYADLETQTRDARGNTTRTLMDVWGRTTQVIPPEEPPVGPGVSYAYDAADRLLSATYGTAYTSLTYDLAGRKVTMTDPDMGTWNYSYDALGNLLSQTDARGCVTTLSYDALNRLTGKVYGAVNCGSGNTNVAYSYDSTAGGNKGIGRRTGMTDGSGSSAWTYDTRGRLTRDVKTIGSTPYTSEWTYNSADLPLTMKYPDNEILTYSYHPQLALKSIFSDLGTSGTGDDYYYLQQARYDAVGRMDIQNLGATSLAVNPLLVNDATFYPWNSQGGRLQRLNAGTYASQASLLDLNYGYDPAGNILTILDVVNSNQKQCFAYDTLQRLTSAAVGVNDSTCSGSAGNGEYANETYAYDLTTGNLSSKTGMGTYTYDTNHKHAVASTSTGWSYQYDANGNMTRRDPPGSDYFDFVYNAENRIYQVKKNGAVIATFTYDGNDARVKSVLGGATTVFVGGYYEVSGVAVTKYYYSGASRFAMSNSSGLTYLLGDHLGSTSVTYRINDSQTIRQLYSPWGVPRYASASLPTKYTFTDQYSYTDDIATPSVVEGFGLLFYNARWYDPYLNRWTSPDTDVPESQGVQAFDRYAYSGNNPVRFIDPTGHDPEEIIFNRTGKLPEPPQPPHPPVPPVDYTDWYSGNYSGCTMCHYAHAQNKSILTNDELATADQNFREWATVGYTSLMVTTAVVGGLEMIGVAPGYATAATSGTTAACADGDCLNEIVTIEEGVQKGVTVLGRNPTYLEVAKDVGGNALNIPQDVWYSMNRAQQWALNQKFLDDAIARGDYFYLASRWADAPTGTFFRQELEYLFSKGYTFSPYQNYLIPPSIP